MAKDCIESLLANAIKLNPSKCLIFYPLGNPSTPIKASYRGLYRKAEQNSHRLRALEGFTIGSPIILHFDDHWDAIVWFWAVRFARGLPVLSSPLSHDPEQRQRHIQNLITLLEDPVCITRSRLSELFDSCATLRIHTLESMEGRCAILPPRKPSATMHPRDTAMLMLTSGSSGDAKAVRLNHLQVIAAVSGKATLRQLPAKKPFLNWVGLDHVASLVEIHLQAMYLGVGQVHVPAVDVISSPRIFLDLLSYHQVAWSFAPNFFLAKLLSAVDSDGCESKGESWDLRNLAFLASGGESNDVEICRAVSSLLMKYGAPRNTVVPGFGMTETCAGAIFNLNCPEYDMHKGYPFASVGKCMKGIELRVTVPNPDGGIRLATPNTLGYLEVRGDVVFDGYYRNREGTAEVLTPEGWFRTGDQAAIDPLGNLRLIGRVKDIININGLKYSLGDLEKTLQRALGERVTCVVGFATRPEKWYTEQITIAFVPTEWPTEPKKLASINDTIIQNCILCMTTKPFIFALKSEALLPKSSLGKILRAQLKQRFERGAFANEIEQYNNALHQGGPQEVDYPASEAEKCLLEDVSSILGIKSGEIGIDTSFFDMGINSMDLIRLKRVIDTRMSVDVPMIRLMTSPTARTLAAAFENLQSTTQAPYHPVVTLRHGGNKTPLWLFHPGVGEVLVFLGLSSRIDDRPVYALRAKGFDGESRFTDLSEVIRTYYLAIKRRQPQGPYAMAGYSYGTMLAFEVSKLLEQDKAEIQFLGGLNLPPHIKSRMQQLNWNACLLHLAYFIGLISEEQADAMEDGLRSIPRREAIARVLDAGDTAVMTSLGLNDEKLVGWANVAYGLQSMAVEYEPSGSVAVLDIFHAIPLKVAAKSGEDWMTNHLSKWKGFCRTEPRFHQVGGSHYTMIGSDHVTSFSQTFKQALEARGL
ncbi:putative NRPS-like protein biosynthetic cluster [Myotisia sp. PD_48]|nr:putative NRPS-like protein biosynthetic cluster [Myotisia sp. PD_48]